METLLQLWPVLAFVAGLFFSGLCVAIGLTLWIMGKLSEQDARRIEMKEAILVEVRERHHTVMSGLDMRNQILGDKIDAVKDKVGAVDIRLVRVETILNGHTKIS